MNRQDTIHLQSERSFLRQQLASLPATAQLTRLSTESRLRGVDKQLAETKVSAREPARARLTFRGRPVVASHGIFAEFGTKATNAFTDVVAKVAAALSGPLASMGRIPNRDQSQMLITSTAVGSFGFELEEHCPSELPLGEESSTEKALELASKLLQSTLGSDDELADSAAGTDPRAVEAVRSFLEILASSDAVCVLECGQQVFRFRDVGQVRQSLERLGQQNLHEAQQALEGEFQGVLPKSRTFEFKLAESGEVVSGKVGPAITDADAINNHLHQRTKISVMTTRVGNGRPRYVLIEEPSWPAGTP